MFNIFTANAVFAYDTNDGVTYILEVNQALDFRDSMEHSLLCVNQSRIDEVLLDDVPQFLDYHNRSTHLVYFPLEDVCIPLAMTGPVSYIPVCYPSDQELEDCIHLELSASNSPRDPLQIQGFQSANSCQIAYSNVNSVEATLLHTNSLLGDIYKNIIINSIWQSRSNNTLTPESLSDLWEIGLHAARDTIRSTTQDHFCVLNGKLSCRVKPHTHQRQYRQLGGYLGSFSSEMFKMKVTSTRGNKYHNYSAIKVTMSKASA
jgi:hypothetical protein